LQGETKAAPAARVELEDPLELGERLRRRGALRVVGDDHAADQVAEGRLDRVARRLAGGDLDVVIRRVLDRVQSRTGATSFFRSRALSAATSAKSANVGVGSMWS